MTDQLAIPSKTLDSMQACIDLFHLLYPNLLPSKKGAHMTQHLALGSILSRALEGLKWDPAMPVK